MWALQMTAQYAAANETNDCIDPYACAITDTGLQGNGKINGFDTLHGIEDESLCCF